MISTKKQAKYVSIVYNQQANDKNWIECYPEIEFKLNEIRIDQEESTNTLLRTPDLVENNDKLIVLGDDTAKKITAKNVKQVTINKNPPSSELPTTYVSNGLRVIQFPYKTNTRTFHINDFSKALVLNDKSITLVKSVKLGNNYIFVGKKPNQIVLIKTKSDYSVESVYTFNESGTPISVASNDTYGYILISRGKFNKTIVTFTLDSLNKKVVSYHTPQNQAGNELDFEYITTDGNYVYLLSNYRYAYLVRTNKELTYQIDAGWVGGGKEWSKYLKTVHILNNSIFFYATFDGAHTFTLTNHRLNPPGGDYFTTKVNGSTSYDVGNTKLMTGNTFAYSSSNNTVYTTFWISDFQDRDPEGIKSYTNATGIVGFNRSNGRNATIFLPVLNGSITGIEDYDTNHILVFIDNTAAIIIPKNLNVPDTVIVNNKTITFKKQCRLFPSGVGPCVNPKKIQSTTFFVGKFSNHYFNISNSNKNITENNNLASDSVTPKIKKLFEVDISSLGFKNKPVKAWKDNTLNNIYVGIDFYPERLNWDPIDISNKIISSTNKSFKIPVGSIPDKLLVVNDKIKANNEQVTIISKQIENGVSISLFRTNGGKSTELDWIDYNNNYKFVYIISNFGNYLMKLDKNFTKLKEITIDYHNIVIKPIACDNNNIYQVIISPGDAYTPSQTGLAKFDTDLNLQLSKSYSSNIYKYNVDSDVFTDGEYVYSLNNPFIYKTDKNLNVVKSYKVSGDIVGDSITLVGRICKINSDIYVAYRKVINNKLVSFIEKLDSNFNRRKVLSLGIPVHNIVTDGNYIYGISAIDGANANVFKLDKDLNVINSVKIPIEIVVIAGGLSPPIFYTNIISVKNGKVLVAGFKPNTEIGYLIQLNSDTLEVERAIDKGKYLSFIRHTTFGNQFVITGTDTNGVGYLIEFDDLRNLKPINFNGFVYDIKDISISVTKTSLPILGYGSNLSTSSFILSNYNLKIQNSNEINVTSKSDNGIIFEIDKELQNKITNVVIPSRLQKLKTNNQINVNDINNNLVKIGYNKLSKTGRHIRFMLISENGNEDVRQVLLNLYKLKD